MYKPGNHITLFLFAVLLFLPVVLITEAFGQISPGKLSVYHKELEGITNCTKCHVLGQRELSTEKCLSCHTALKARIDANAGYHASDEVSGGNCQMCHVEHHGRETELVFWPDDKEGFDHSLAGFPLDGAHQKQKCDACHDPAFHSVWLKQQQNTNPERTFLGLNSSCISCHEDEHRDQLTDECLICHTTESWTPATGFDHTKTGYPLTGRHQSVSCAECHPWQEAPLPSNPNAIRKQERTGQYATYSGLEFGDCDACHQDPHQGRFGSTCNECHTTSGFGQIKGNRFDHSLTQYPLEGKHSNVQCALCHTSGDMTQPVPHEQCRDCHSDEHRGQLAKRADGGACSSCHTVEGFLPAAFSMDDHNKSDYPLTGSHRAVPCFLCHVQVQAQNGESYTQLAFESTRCNACHTDIHQGQLDIWINREGCEFCHNTETWQRTAFDHTLARFPLEGRHREILCLECHRVENEAGGQQVWMKPLDMRCSACHTDPHMEQFAVDGVTTCETCHSPQGWKQLDFDHTTDTKFPLTGGHENVSCGECHLSETTPNGEEYIRYRPVEMTCIACHGSGGQ